MISYTEGNVIVEANKNGEYTIKVGDNRVIVSKDDYKSIASSFEYIMEMEKAVGI